MTYLKLNNPGTMRGFANPVLRSNFMNEFLGKGSDCYAYDEPRYKVDEKDDAYKIIMAVPGLVKEDLSIMVEEGVLTIKTIDKEEAENRDDFLVASFEKQFRLSKKIDQDAISAHTENGVLSINLPKVPEEVKKPARTIEIA